MEKQEFNITVYTENQIGLLNRIAIIFTRRKINIDSLNTSPSEVESIHRFNIVITEYGRCGTQTLPPDRKTGRGFESVLSYQRGCDLAGTGAYIKYRQM